MYNTKYASTLFWRNIGLLLTLVLIIGLMGGCASKAPTKPGELEQEAASGEKVICEITVSEEATQSLVTIKGNQPLPYTSVKHLLPLGVVLYFPKTSLKGVQELYTPESALIKGIITSEQTDNGGFSRVQIDLKDDIPYKATQENNQILVYFRKPIAGLAEGEKTEAVVPKETVKPVVPEPEKGIEVEKVLMPGAAGIKPEGLAAVSAKTEMGGKPTWVNRIDFVMLKGNKSRVIVGTTKAVRFETVKPSDKKLLLKLFSAKIPKFQKRPLITTRFKSAVDHVVPIQTAKMGDTAVIAIQLREAVPYRVEQKENILIVELEPSTVPPRPMPDVKAPEWQKVLRETEAEVEEIEKEAEVPPEEPVLAGAEKVYTGQKISLDFQDADIRHVFRILHEISGQNFVIGDDIKGRITLKLDNVPWDQVLDLILQMNQLGRVEEGNIIRIAKLKTLEVEKKALKAKMMAEREVEKEETLYTVYIPVNYADASIIKAHLVEIRSERGRLSVDQRTNMIIMKDILSAIDNAKEVVKRLDVVTPQVLIEARIVEANTDFAREIGIQWGGTYGIQPGDAEYGIGPQRGYSTLGGTYGLTGAVDNWIVNLPAAGATSGINFNFARFGLTNLTLQANLLAMESQGKGRIISSPRVLTLDNKQAYIEQGVEIPYQVLEEGSYSLKWASAVLKLEVTPHITMDRRIAMKIIAKKDAPDWSRTVQGAPAIDKKETGTELLLNDGDTIVIGGIIIREEAVSTMSVPGLSKIPILGWLFRTTGKRMTKKELLIFITPTIVELEEAPLMEQAVVSEAVTGK